MAVDYTEAFPKRPTTRPHARVFSDTSAVTGSASDSNKTLMLVGNAEGGKPNTVYRLTNMVQARDIFRSGDLVDAMELAWNPSMTNISAGEILAIRAQEATNATLTQGGLKFESLIYGEEANSINIELDDNAFGDKRLKVSLNGEDTVYDGLGTIFTVAYEGESPYASVEITGTQGQAQELILSSGADAVTAVEAKFSLGDKGIYVDAFDLANAISSVAGFEATMGFTGDKNIATKGLDPISETVINKGTPVKVTGLYADIENQLAYSNLVSVEVTNAGTALENFGPVNLTGGDNGTSPTSWASKFAQLANQGGYYLVPLTDSQTIHSEARHFVTERTNEGEPMRAIVGGKYDEQPNEVMSRASALKSDRVSYVGFSGKRTMSDGRQLQIPGYLMASQVAGYTSAVALGESIMFKPFALTELSTVHDANTMDSLNTSGVIMAGFNRNQEVTNFRIDEDLTTYRDPSNPIKNTNSAGEAHDFLVSELRNRLEENFIGTKNSMLSPSIIKTDIVSFLDQKVRENEVQDYDAEDIQVVINGNVASVTFTVYPIMSLRKVDASIVYKMQTISA